MAVTLWLASTSVAQQGFFKGLGDLLGDPPFEAYAWAVSADGSTVVGVGTTAIEGNINYREAFRWTAETGMVGLGDLPGGYVYSEAYAVSADGSVVVGTSSSTNGLEAFRWTAETGMVGLGDLPDDPFESYAYGVSADGSIVVGAATTSGSLEEPVREAFRWTVLTGMNELDRTAWWDSAALGISADGSVVVGAHRGVHTYPVAFRWTTDTGMVNLGLLPGGMFYSVAYAVSGDGSVVVGCGDSPNGWAEAALWTAETGWVGLGDLPGGDFYSIAYAVSPDGSIVVGRGTHEHPLYSEAFIWDAQNGMRMVRDWLAGNGVVIFVVGAESFLAPTEHFACNYPTFTIL